jgi:hypothetical protein
LARWRISLEHFSLRFEDVVAGRVSAEALKNIHRTIMQNIHPDAGGSTYLSLKVNEARDVVLGTTVKVRDEDELYAPERAAAAEGGGGVAAKGAGAEEAARAGAKKKPKGTQETAATSGGGGTAPYRVRVSTVSLLASVRQYRWLSSSFFRRVDLSLPCCEPAASCLSLEIKRKVPGQRICAR